MKTLQLPVLIAVALAGADSFADKVIAYQCESRCVAVDFERNLIQILPNVESEMALTLKEAWMDANAKCEGLRYTLSWYGSATSMLLVKNEVFDIDSDRTRSSSEIDDVSSSSSSDYSSFSSVDVYRGKTKLKANPFRIKVKADPSVAHSTRSSTLNTFSSYDRHYEFHFYERNVLKVKLEMSNKSEACRWMKVNEYEVVPTYSGPNHVGG